MAFYGAGPNVRLQGANNFDLRAGTGEMFIDTDSQIGAVRVKNSGDVQSRGKFILDNGTYKLNLGMSAGMTGDVNFDFPATDPLANQVLKYNGGTLIWDNESITVEKQFVVRKNPAASEFSSVADACNAAALEVRSDTARIVVYVYPGTYVETETVVILDYVHVVGQSLEACIIVPSGNFHVVQMSNQSSMAFINVRDAAVGYFGIVMDNVGDYALCHKVDVDNCDGGISCAVSTVDSYCYFEYCSCNGCPVVGLQVISGFGFICKVTIENHFFEPPCATFISSSGADAYLSANVCVINGDLTNTGVDMFGGEMSVRGFYIEDCAIAIHVDTTAVNPECFLSAVLFHNNTVNIQVDSATCTGQFDGYSEYDKTIINPSSAFFITNKDNNIVTVAKKGGDFTSVKAAMDSISGATSTNQFSVYVGPGVYNEDPFTMKAYVTLSGFSAAGTIINANDVSGNLVTMVGNSAVQTLTLTGATSGILIKYSGDAGGGTIYISDMFFRDGQTLMDVDSTVGPALVNMKFDQIRSVAVFSTGFKFTSGTNPISVLIESLSWSPTSGGLMPTKFFDITSSSPGSVTNNVFLSNVFIGQRNFAASGIGMNIEGACYVSVLAGVFGGFATGLTIPATTVTAPTISFQSVNYINNTADISIQNTGTLGSLNVGATRSKMSIAVGTVLSIITRDPTLGDFLVSGNLYQGSNFSAITNVTPAIQNAVGTGVISGGTFSFSGSTLTVQSGTGYLLQGGTQLTYVTWTTQNAVLAAGSYYIWIDSNGVLQTNATSPSTLTVVLIGRVFMDGSGMVYLQRIAKDSVQMVSKHDSTFRAGLGVLFVSGCIATAGTTGLRVSVSSGTYIYATATYAPSSTTDITMIGFYGSSGSYNSLTAVPLFYDSAGVVTAIPAGKWVKHLLYVVGSGADQKYILIYGQQLFDLEVDAQTGNLPSAPSFIGSNAAELCGIIVTDSDVGPLPSDRFRDIRNIRGLNRISGSTASADHNSLLNLTTGNPHTQYVQKAGDTMTGDLSLGGNDITNCTTYNGITIESISSRLLPAGADPLATAAPVTINNANSIGIANSYARSDHVHAHGNQTSGSLHAVVTGSVNGFMSSTDKNKLDASTSTATASTLVQRSAAGRSNFSLVGISGATWTATFAPSGSMSADYTLTLPVDDGTSGQVLSTDGSGILSWITTITDPTTTAGDLIYRNPSNVFTRLPIGTSNQVLTVTGASTIAWATPTAYLSDPMTTAGDLIFRNSSNVTARLGIGTTGQMLTTTGATTVAWTTPFTDITTTAGDLPYRNSSNVYSRLPVGSANQVLTVTSTNTLGWATPFSDPMTTAGDIIYRNGSNTTTRLPIGTTGQLLAVTGATTVAWQSNTFISDPTSTAGDIIYRNPSNVLTRLGLGSAGQMLTTTNGTTIAWTTPFTDITTTAGDLPYRNSSNVYTRLPIGTSNQVLTVTGANTVAWATPFSDPMTTAGDLIFRNGSNVTTRLPIGTTGQLLAVTGATTVAWQTNTFISDPTTTAGDIIYRNPSNVLTRLGLGSAGQMLTTTNGTTVAWTTPFTDPMTTAGDIIYRNPSNLTTRLGIGSLAQVLTVTGASTLGWSTPFSDVTTTAGDIAYRNSSNTYTRLPIGTTGQLLAVTGANTVAWQSNTFISDPMTTAGDIVYRNSGNTTARLPIGTTGQMLTTTGATTVAWTTPFTDVTTTAGDLPYRNSSNVYSRLPIGTSNQVLTVTGANTVGWATPTTGLSDPMTTAGDMIYRNGGNTTARFPAGTIGQQLAMQGGLPTWREPIAPAREMIFYDDFNGTTSPFGDTVWLLTSSGGFSITQAFPATSTNTFGCTRMAFGANNTQWSISKNVTTGIYFGVGSSYTEAAIFIETLSTLADLYIFRIGYGDTISGTTDNTDGVYFEYNRSTSVNWLIKTAAGAVITTTTTSTPVATGWNKFGIEATSSNINYYVNDVLIGSIGSNIPTGATQRCGAIVRAYRTGGGATVAYPIYVDYFYYHFNFSANRY